MLPSAQSRFLFLPWGGIQAVNLSFHLYSLPSLYSLMAGGGNANFLAETSLISPLQTSAVFAATVQCCFSCRLGESTLVWDPPGRMALPTIPAAFLLVLWTTESCAGPVTVRFLDSATLPCISKDPAPVDQPAVKWVLSTGRPVLYVEGGRPHSGPGFEHRAQMSGDKARLGNYSLTIAAVTFSDTGLYECYREAERDHLQFLEDTYLTVTAHEENVTHQSGASLSLPLHTTGPVEVLFDPAGSTQSSRVLLSSAGPPDPGYEHRVSVQNSSLTLHSLTPADQGSYTVRDLQGNTISTVTVTVGAQRVTVTLQPGASLSVPLLTGEPVEVLFDPAGGGNWTSVCSVQNSTASCVPQYRDRVLVENQELRLQDLRASDEGIYTVLLSHIQKAVSTVSLTVEDPLRHRSVGVITGVTGVGVAGVILAILGVWVGMRRSRTTIRNDRTYELTRRDDAPNDSSSAISPPADQPETGSQNGVCPQVPGVQVTEETGDGHSDPVVSNGHRLQG
ncbi:uncharacterized protein [Lepisosteus oculatus]|uniref:uncharacterized protein isoform X1 n=1 Tax=Lepisosteus oculatus TaxID=7918 RepID=UPI0035F50C77